MSDLISRADAIEAVENNSYGMGSRASVKAIKALPCKTCGYYNLECPKDCEHSRPSAEAPKPTGDLISREDALRELNGCCSNWEDDAKVEEIIDALPSADAVSMEEHVKELNDLAVEWKSKFVKAEKRTEEIYDEAMAKVANECKECKERLQNLRPSAEAVQGWIPCSERLPLVGGEFLVTLFDQDGTWVSTAKWNMTFGGRWQDIFPDDGYRDISNVIAWKTLPKPYTKGDNDEER